MADTNNDSTATATDAKKQKTTAEGMTAYRTFDSPADATAYLEKCAADFADFTEQPFAFRGVDPESGEYDPAIYTDDMRVRVAVLKNRAEVKGQPSTVRAIVVGPVPSLESMLSDDAGKAWLQKIMDKETNHVLVRPLRESDNLEASVLEMPTTREAFITSARDAGGVMDTFNEVYDIVASQMKKAPIWAKHRVNKSDMKKAMESKGYALEYFNALEDRGEGKESLFVTALRFGKAVAEKKGLDPAIFDKWIATRDAATFSAPETDEDADDLDLEAMVADLDKPEDATEDSTDTTTDDAAPTA